MHTLGRNCGATLLFRYSWLESNCVASAAGCNVPPSDSFMVNHDAAVIIVH
jgi:hypothetical protein